MSADLFVYGTLQFPEILRAVTGCTFPSVEATLHGWARYRVRDASYPALRAERGATTPGRLFRGVDDASLAKLDAFEGSLYDRILVRVEPDTEAFVYATPEHRAHQLTREPWDPDQFGTREREAFLAAFHRGDAP